MKPLHLIVFALLLCPSVLLGGSGALVLKSSPKAETIGEILPEGHDAGPTGFENHELTRFELIEFLSKGRLKSPMDPHLIEVATQEEKSKAGGPVYCSGVFATTDGRVFKFRRFNKRVLQITGKDGYGFLMLDKDEAAPGDGGKPSN